MILAYIPGNYSFCCPRCVDFHFMNLSPLASKSALLDGVARRLFIQEKRLHANDSKEALLHSELLYHNYQYTFSSPMKVAMSSQLILNKSQTGTGNTPPLSRWFESRSSLIDWSTASDNV